MEKIKIAFFIPFLDQSIVGLFDEIVKQNKFDLSVITSFWIEEQMLNAKYISRTIFKRDYVKRLIPLSREFELIMKKQDVIVSFFTKKDWDSKLLKHLLKNKLFFFFSERLFRKKHYSFFEIIKKRLSSFVYQKSIQKYKPLLLAVGQYAYCDYLHYGCYKERALYSSYFLLSCSYPDDMFIRSKYDGIKKRILKVLVGGSFIECKEIDNSFRIVKSLEDKNIEVMLTIFGDGDQRNYLMNKVKEYNLSSYIEWLGFINFEKYNSLMMEYDVYICTGNEYEGFNCSIQNAVINGTYVIMNNKNATHYTLKGLKYSSFDTNKDESFEHCINEMLKEFDNSIGETIITNRRLFMKEWSLSSAAQRLYTICDLYLNKGKTKEDIICYYDKGIFSKADN